jgi:hypothetical protein
VGVGIRKIARALMSRKMDRRRSEPGRGAWRGNEICSAMTTGKALTYYRVCGTYMGETAGATEERLRAGQVVRRGWVSARGGARLNGPLR